MSSHDLCQKAWALAVESICARAQRQGASDVRIRQILSQESAHMVAIEAALVAGNLAATKRAARAWWAYWQQGLGAVGYTYTLPADAGTAVSSPR